jgi:hypothetical protein
MADTSNGQDWKAIAERIIREVDPKKIFNLAEELNKALAERKGTRNGIHRPPKFWA